MGKVKELWQEQIDSATEEYHDEVSIDFGYGKEEEALKKAKVRLVSKLSALGLELDQIEEIVDNECH